MNPLVAVFKEDFDTVENNIVCADGLRYHYRFDDSHPYDDEIREKEKQKHFDSLFSYD